MPGAFLHADRMAILRTDELALGAQVLTGELAGEILKGFPNRDPQDAYNTRAFGLTFTVATIHVRDLRTGDKLEMRDDDTGWRQVYKVESRDAEHSGWTTLGLLESTDAP